MLSNTEAIRNKLEPYFQRTHFWLTTQVKDALSRSEGDANYVNLLFISYIICFATLFFTQKDPTDWSYDPAQKLYIYLLMPLAFAPLKFSAIKMRGISFPIPIKFSLYNPLRNIILCRTPFFGCVLIYTVSQAMISYFLPTPHQLYFQIYFYYFLAPLLTFIMVTIRLCCDFPNFYYKFYRLLTPVVAVNAAINLYIFFKSVPDFAAGIAARVSSAYGFALGNNPNLDCIIYASFFIGALATLIGDYSKVNLIILTPALLPLAIIIIFEQSRSPLLGLLIGLLVLGLMNFRKMNRRLLWKICLGLIIILVIIQNIIPGGLYTYIGRADAFRFELWRRAIDVIKEAPIFGYGARDDLAINISAGIFLHPHNILLGAQLRGGIIGLVSMTFILVLGVLKSFYYAQFSKNLVPLCVFLVFLISGLFDFEIKIFQAGWEWAAFWITIAFALGADANLRRPEEAYTKVRSFVELTKYRPFFLNHAIINKLKKRVNSAHN